MTNEMKFKLSNFIDSLIENKFDKIIIDIWTEKSKKHTYYSLDIDTSGNSNRPLLDYNLHFAVCPESGLVLLSKDDYEEFRTNDFDFAKKYTLILTETKNRILSKNLDFIIDSSCKELKLNRDENIKKLIG